MDYIDSSLLSLFETALKLKKGALRCTFELSKKKKSNDNWYIDQTEVGSLEKTKIDCLLVICLNKNDQDRYEIKIFEKSIPTPFLRYESKGSTHLNRDSSIPLHERKVETPHFHVFDDDGFSKAYKNDTLKKLGKNIDIENAIDIFFEEGLISCVNDALRINFQPVLK